MTRTFSPLLVLLLALLAGCGVNPVTGKQEIQFVSEQSELQIGAQHYAPSRQSQGGDLIVFPELNRYVAEVGGKLAAVSDRALPYEFVVLNNSVPNAWALPGGKIAVNRGLLTSLENEAELAAVLGHEIVHAAARHGAKAQERGTLLMAGVLAAQVGVMLSDTDSNLGNLLVLGAGVGAQLINMRYGRGAELESDLYGMRYMQRAGYDPSAAVTLQQKFVALSQAENGRRASWLEGLFASHPPSDERVARNRDTLAGLGTGGGTLGAERYQSALAPLRAAKPAYDKADEALAAAKRKDFARARALAAEAARMQPQEGRFQQVLGDVALAQKQPQVALTHYEQAIQLDPGYFGGHLGAGLAAFRMGSDERARQSLSRSAELLPTAPALYHLGLLAKRAGNTSEAMRYFAAASESDSEFGRQATVEVLREELPRNPSRYLATDVQRDARGALVVVIQNRTSVPLADVQVTPELVGANGSIEQRGATLRVGRALAPNERVTLDAGIGPVSDDALRRTRVRIDYARAVEP